jgi:hypothetical protein
LSDKTSAPIFQQRASEFRQQKKWRAASFAGNPDFSTVRQVLELDLQRVEKLKEGKN